MTKKNIKKETVIQEKIRQAMKEAGLTQTKLANKLNVKHPLINAWLSGRRNPTVTSLKKIAAATGKPLQYFFENSGNVGSIGDGNKIGEQNFTSNPSDIELLRKDIELLKKEIEILKLKNELKDKKKK
ncbi:MAG: helix-turn-helix domain-containing protein [Elusimicrobiota bacterium]|jgi:transcriptional regulator with XRE-family HTH domain|nr:helix-turn-helix domain-containing protein [Elusimicrobiota bacterium]